MAKILNTSLWIAAIGVLLALNLKACQSQLDGQYAYQTQQAEVWNSEHKEVNKDFH